jgi:hypothetical protein
MRLRNESSGSSWLVTSFLVTGVMVLSGTVLARGKGGCEREAISMLMSPDDAWVALVHENICSDGAFVTTVTDTVQLTRRDVTTRLN